MRLLLPHDIDLGEYATPFDNVHALAAYLLAEENCLDPALANRYPNDDTTYFIQVL